LRFTEAVNGFLAQVLGMGFDLDITSLEYNVYLKEIKDKLEAKPLIQRGDVKKIAFIGDLHGDFKSLKNAYERVIKDKSIDLIVFLGDYVDRGPRQLEVLVGVTLLKISDPDRVILLRGNHETPSMNRSYGFISKLRRIFGNNWKLFYKTFVKEIYTRLPVSLVIKTGKHKIFVVHGGIPIEPITINDIKEIKLEFEPEDPILLQLLWNDPLDGNGKVPSPRGPGIYLFGRDVFQDFIERNKIDLVVRAHEPVNGVEPKFDNKLYTVFSCRYYDILPSTLIVNNELNSEILSLK